MDLLLPYQSMHSPLTLPYPLLIPFQSPFSPSSVVLYSWQTLLNSLFIFPYSSFDRSIPSFHWFLPSPILSFIPFPSLTRINEFPSHWVIRFPHNLSIPILDESLLIFNSIIRSIVPWPPFGKRSSLHERSLSPYPPFLFRYSILLFSCPYPQSLFVSVRFKCALPFHSFIFDTLVHSFILRVLSRGNSIEGRNPLQPWYCISLLLLPSLLQHKQLRSVRIIDWFSDTVSLSFCNGDSECNQLVISLSLSLIWMTYFRPRSYPFSLWDIKEEKVGMTSHQGVERMHSRDSHLLI